MKNVSRIIDGDNHVWNNIYDKIQHQYKNCLPVARIKFGGVIFVVVNTRGINTSNFFREHLVWSDYLK